jgi:putative transposase
LNCWSRQTRLNHTLYLGFKLSFSFYLSYFDRRELDIEGNEIGRPFITTVIESNSGCIAGFHISFKKPGSHEVALALRHAFLPKEYGEEYKLQKKWEVSGIPQYFVTDRAKEFKSNHLKQIAAQLGIKLCLRAYPQQGG